MRLQGSADAGADTTYTITGTGTMVLLQNTSAANATIVNNSNNGGAAGFLQISTTGPVSIGALSGSGRTVFAGAGGGGVGVELIVGGLGTDTTYSGRIINSAGGSGSLTKVGAGTLTLSGNNAHTLGTTISGGTLSVSADNNLGNTSGGLTLLNGNTLIGATLQTTASFTTNRATTLGTGGGTFSPDAGTTLTHGGVIA
ncbi:MAG: autotransporter-associated beta strand repeat-containing protein, partial [Cyanobacteria bacterium P01_F01_bin.153]